MREYFLKTSRIGFSHWTEEDFPLALSLWGDPQVSKYLCAKGVFSCEEVKARLADEIEHFKTHRISRFPIFLLSTGEFIGCCGIHLFNGNFELGYHLLPKFWRKGYAAEAASAAANYYFSALHLDMLYAGHHPDNKASAHILKKLGFEYIGDDFYEPTGQYHPLYTKKQSI